ncbi:CDP-diacylglycerol--glycerol-3-phosphate 3-phosphatidyltransferase 2-like [Cucurbita moschata]|uniref:CDP-diacylglycerol--glycerol-3-phosphate 1-phosphatidyltransferase n=1 Tax=Cucurbita moschata TaxID=3662 RepID=A0A6J1FRH4_CUCMO|nr:CDP-diacylglycerol--glycerol-3-phosphate 3-phosphatidyltransferase 2-like [Cucurbita moschata]
MLSLKQTSIMAATFHVHNPFFFYSSNSPRRTLQVWLRSVSATANATATRRYSLGLPQPLPPVPSGGGDRDSVIYGGGIGWTSAPNNRLVYEKGPPKILGFRSGYNTCFSIGSKRCNSISSEKRGGVFGLGSGSASDSASPPSAGSEFVANMGSESKDHNNGWYQDDLDSQSQSPLMHQHEPQRSKLLTLPTILTLARVAAVPIFVCTFYVNNWWGTTATTSIFIAAAVTDWLDGYIARKMRLGSAFGAFLDPVADKLMVAATLILLCTQPLEVSVFGHVPWLLTLPSIAIIGREITMSAVREWAASQNSKLLEAVAVNNLGKWKTATQMIALTTLLASRDSSLGGSGILVATGVVLLYISAWLAVWSLFVYSRKISKVLFR